MTTDGYPVGVPTTYLRYAYRWAFGQNYFLNINLTITHYQRWYYLDLLTQLTVVTRHENATLEGAAVQLDIPKLVQRALAL